MSERWTTTDPSVELMFYDNDVCFVAKQQFTSGRTDVVHQFSFKQNLRFLVIWNENRYYHSLWFVNKIKNWKKKNIACSTLFLLNGRPLRVTRDFTNFSNGCHRSQITKLSYMHINVYWPVAVGTVRRVRVFPLDKSIGFVRWMKNGICGFFVCLMFAFKISVGPLQMCIFIHNFKSKGHNIPTSNFPIFLKESRANCDIVRYM